MTTGRLVVTPAGVGDPALGIGPGEPPGPAGNPGTTVVPAGAPPSLTPPWHWSQESPPTTAGDEQGADWQGAADAPHGRIAGAAAGAAPGGTNPGGRWPKHFSYFQTSSWMYRSLSVLQPLRPATATAASNAMP